VLVQVLVQEQR